MATIHILPQPGKTSPRNPLVTPPQPATPQRPDEAMMYAWSIGTTPAARALAPAPRRESCPPEVYLG